MKLVRHSRSRSRTEKIARQTDETFFKTDRGAFSRCLASSRSADRRELLTPVTSTMSWDMGVSYRRFADEGKVKAI